MHKKKRLSDTKIDASTSLQLTEYPVPSNMFSFRKTQTEMVLRNRIFYSSSTGNWNIPMKKTPRRRITVMSSLNDISTNQLGNRVVVRRVGFWIGILSPAMRRGIGSRNWVLDCVAKLHWLAGLYDNPMPTLFRAPIAGLKLPALESG